MQFAVIESYQEVAKPTSQRGLAALRDATNIRALAQMDRQRLHQVWRYRFSRVTIIAAVLCTIYGNVVAAQTTYVWNYFSSGPINTVGDNWSNPFRWTPSGPPPPTGSARIDTENFANLIFLSPSSSSPQDQSIRELVFDGVNPNFLNGRLFIDDLILNNVDMRSGVDLTDSPLSDALIATRTTIEDNSYIVVDQDSSSLGTLRINGDVQVAQFESFLSNPIEVVTHTGRILGNRSLGVEVRGRVVGSGTLTFGKEANTTARFSMSASTRTFPNEHAGGTNIEPAVILGIDDASLLGDDGATLQLGGRLQLDASMTLARPIAVYGQQAAEIDLNGRDLNISGPITGGTDLRIIGDRTLTLSGVENTHTGTLFISNDASLRLDANTNATSSIDLGLRANALLLRNEQVDNTARLRLRDNSVFDLNGFTETIGSILADDSTISGSGTLNVLGEIEGKVETRVNAGLLSIAGEFTGPLSTLTKTGDGALRLSGSSSDLFGLTRVDGGELLLDRTGGAQSNRFGAAVSNLRIGTGATVRLLRANQIRDNRDVSIDSFGQLNLEDIDETIRALIFVDGGGGSVVGSGTLTVTDTIERSGGGSAAVNPIGTPLALNGPNVTLNVVEGGLFAQSSVTSTGSVSKTGAGRFLTTAGNEISIASNLTISQGEMVLPVNQAVPEDATIPGTTTVGGTVSIAGNGVLELGDGTLNTA
ncbi:MAG: autotransporter-associated beta strand repeat-containing protein, partial [Planctomycetota bacterium]